MAGREWIKIHVDPWLKGMRDERPEFRGLWTDLLCLAGCNLYGDEGKVEFLPGVGPTQEQLACGFNVPLELIREFEMRCLQTERIIIGPGRVITICNWDDYQSEYGRTRKYRSKSTEIATGKSTRKATRKATEKSTKKATRKATERVEKSRVEKKEVVVNPVGSSEGERQRRVSKTEQAKLDEAEFDELWEIQTRLRSDQSRKPAFAAWHARVYRDKIPRDWLRAATVNLEKTMIAQKRAPDRIMYAQTFYGPNERWRPFLQGVPDAEKLEKGRGWAPPSEPDEFRGGNRTNEV